tara:strand:- start:57943 stop:58638 length:696 start_codon:yes stop_codon:yes gene_type:complete
MSNVIVYSLTKGDEMTNTLVYKSVRNLNDVAICMVTENTEAIAKGYNEFLDHYDIDEYDYAIFCHDDVSIEDANLAEKLDKAIGDDSEFAICGSAGTSSCVIKDKCLWHRMHNDIKSLSGAVAHYTDKDDTECFMTNFGPSPKRVIMLDGLFLAVNIKKVKEAGVRFDESYPSKFHFYDLDFCLEANKAGLKLTTYPIWMVHKSHGLEDINNPEWDAGNQYFKDKWGIKNG